METKTLKKHAMDVLISLYDFHTKLFHNVLVEISEEDAANRLGTKANHIGWIAGSLVYQRYEIAKAVGISLEQATVELFRDSKGIQDNVNYPALAEYKKDWDQVSGILKNTLENLTEDQLNGPDPFGMPGDMKLFDAITFSIDREAYCIGQIALYRRLLGYEAMKYD